MAVRRGPHIIKLHDSNPPLLGRGPSLRPCATRAFLRSTRAPPPRAPPLRTPAFALIVGLGCLRRRLHGTCRARVRGARPRRPGGAHRPAPGARPRQPALGPTGEARTQVQRRQGPREPTEAGPMGCGEGVGPAEFNRGVGRREQGQRRSTRARREESGGRESPAQGQGQGRRRSMRPRREVSGGRDALAKVASGKRLGDPFPGSLTKGSSLT